MAATDAPLPKQSLTPGSAMVLLHLALLVVLLLGLPYLMASEQHRVVESLGRPALYAGGIAAGWMLLAYVWVGMRRQRLTLAEITGGKWSTPQDVLIDVVVAAGFWIVAYLILFAVEYEFGLAGQVQRGEALRKVAFVRPANAIEIILWLLASATSGFCDEIVFRGYLQRLSITLTKSSVIGILVSAAIFGVWHGYEVPRMVQYFVFGLMFGALAHFRKSLRPGMIAHAWHDSFVGILLYVGGWR